MSEINPRDFGRLEAEVKALTEAFRAQTTLISALSDRLEEMNSTLAEARGGWRTLLWFGGAASAAGAGVAWALTHLRVT